jgi:hypothetical protein
MSTYYASNLLTVGVMSPESGGFINWLKWCIILISIALIILPAVFFLFTYVAHKISHAKEKPTVKRNFLALTYAISPYGQLLWMSFGIALLMVNWAYPFKAFVSDPLGWSWNFSRLGWTAESAHALFAPFGAQYLPLIQFIFTVVALAFAIQTTYALSLKLYGNDTTAALKTSVVMSIFYFLATIIFMWVFIG